MSRLQNAMNLAKFKKALIFIIPALAFAAVIFFGFFKRGEEPPETEAAPPVPAPIIELPGTEISTTKSSFIIAESLFPTIAALPVYAWEDRPLFDNFSTLASFAASLGLTDYKALKDVFDDEIYLFTGSKGSLSAPKNFSRLSFGEPLREGSYVLASEAAIPSLEEAAEVARQFLEKNNFGTDLLVVNEATRSYLKPQKGEPPLIETSDKVEARAVLVEFQMSVGNYPVYTPLSRIYAAQFIVGPGGEIVSLKMRNFGKVGSVLGNYALKSKKEVEEALSAGEGKLVFTSEIPFGDLKEFSSTRVYLAYLQSEAATLQPIYVLQGKGLVGEKRMEEIVLYLPAIAKKYLQ